MPIQIDCRRITLGLAGGSVGKRRLRYAIAGSAVPVTAKTPKKKNSQRGPTVGRVKFIMKIRPPQPARPKIKAAGKNELTEGEFCLSINYRRIITDATLLNLWLQATCLIIAVSI